MARVDPMLLVAVVLASGCGTALPEGTIVGDGGAATSTGPDADTGSISGVATGVSSSITTADPTSGTPTSSSDDDTTAAPATGTGSTSGVGSSSDAGGSTGVPTNCGDGVVDGNEDCDDMNGDELDGCTSACTLGPTGLSFGPVTTSEEMGGTDTYFYFDDDEDCPAGQVLVGLSGGLVPNEGWLGTVRGRCGTIDLGNANPPTIDTGPGAMLPQHGQYGSGGAWEVRCPDGQLLVGAEGRAGSVFDQILVHCAVPSVVGADGALAIQLDPGDDDGPEGDGGGSAVGPIACDDDAIATGVHLSTSSYFVRIALRCRTISLAY